MLRKVLLDGDFFVGAALAAALAKMALRSEELGMEPAELNSVRMQM